MLVQWLSVGGFTSTETVGGLLWTGTQDSHLDFHTAAALWLSGWTAQPLTYDLPAIRRLIVRAHPYRLDLGVRATAHE